MLYYFYEIVDWEDGNDLMFSYWVPLLEEEVNMLTRKYRDGRHLEDHLLYKLLERAPRITTRPDNSVIFDKGGMVPGEPMEMMNKHLGYNYIAKLIGKPAEELCGVYVVSDAIVEVSLDTHGNFVVKDRATGADRSPFEALEFGRRLDEPGQQLH